MVEDSRTLHDWEYCDFWEFAADGQRRLGTDDQDEDFRFSTSSEVDAYDVLDWFIDCETSMLRVGKTCPLCSTLLQSDHVMYNDQRQDPYLDSLMGFCPYCRHWRWCVREQVEGEPNTCYETVMVSKLRSFDDLPDFTSAELAQALRVNDKLRRCLEPSSFEKFIGDVLCANYINCEVIHIGRSHDRGVDLIFIDAGKKQHLVQVKCHRKRDESEGAPTVRSLLGALVQAGKPTGILVSNAKRFTSEAQIAVSDAWRNTGMIVELYDRGKLNRMLDPLLPDKPWRLYMSRIFPDLADYYTESFHIQRDLQ
jgi:hypothetical protein